MLLGRVHMGVVQIGSWPSEVLCKRLMGGQMLVSLGAWSASGARSWWLERATRRIALGLIWEGRLPNWPGCACGQNVSDDFRISKIWAAGARWIGCGLTKPPITLFGSLASSKSNVRQSEEKWFRNDPPPPLILFYPSFWIGKAFHIRQALTKADWWWISRNPNLEAWTGHWTVSSRVYCHLMREHISN